GIGVVEEAALFHEETARVHAGTVAAVPAHRPLAHRLLHGLHGLADVLALLGLAELVVLHPAPAERAHVPAGIADGGGDGGVALQRERAAEHRERELALVEETLHAPEPDAAAVLEHALGGEIAALHAVVAAASLGERGLREAVVLRVVFGAFLVVDDEVHCDAGVAGPLRVRRLAGIADEITHHEILL